MSNKPRLKYEKPISIDMGQVAPILGACSTGYDPNVVPGCTPGATATFCMSGGAALGGCYPTGTKVGPQPSRFFSR